MQNDFICMSLNNIIIYSYNFLLSDSSYATVRRKHVHVMLKEIVYMLENEMEVQEPQALESEVYTRLAHGPGDTLCYKAMRTQFGV